jgi:Na+/H+-dicarboxylate symporter
MGRSATNVVGNSIATAVVSKWEGELRPEAVAQAEIDADEGLAAPAAA